MKTVRRNLTIGLLICLVLAGCTGKNTPGKQVIGQWSGDMSADAVASRIAQLKSDYPQETRPVMMDMAKDMGLISIDLREDGSVTVVHKTTTYQGTWKYDAAREDIELDLAQTKTSSSDASEVQRIAWIATFDRANDTLALFMNDREVFDYYKRVTHGKKSGIFTLKRK